MQPLARDKARNASMHHRRAVHEQAGCATLGRMAAVTSILGRLAGVEPTHTCWNTLIGTFGVAGDMDGAYVVWQRMLKRGMTPDKYTRVLSLPAMRTCNIPRILSGA